MSLGFQRTRRFHKSDSSSDSEGKDILNDKSTSNNLIDKQQDSILHPEFKLDLEKSKIFNLKSKKGHYTYYTTKIFSKGIFYFEVKIINTDFDILTYIKSKSGNSVIKKEYNEERIKNINKYLPTVRIGIIKEGNDYEIPIGSLKNSYAYRSKDGFLLKEGKYLKGNPTFKTGDIIGCLIHLKPPKPKFLMGIKNEEINLDDKCYMDFYINGKELPYKLEDIKEGDYHFGITLYNFAEAKIIFDPLEMKYLTQISNNFEINPLE